MRRATIILPALILVIVVFMSSIFIVDEREKALVLQFGQIRNVQEEPGLAFKLPFIQQVVRYDDRILSIETDPIEVTPSDDRRLIVDAFARYRIANVVEFREAVGAGGMMAAEDRLESILRTQVRAVLGSDGVTSNTILSADRAELMARIRDAARIRAQALGLDIVDVRLKQTALPDQNLESTFARMRAEREREAADEIARGEEAAQRVRALADRTVVELVSEATRESEITRGEADAQRNAIFAEAFTPDPEFFEFYRSLTAYNRALLQGGTTMVMSPDSEFFNYLRTAEGRQNGAIGAAAPAGAEAPGVPEAGAASAPGDTAGLGAPEGDEPAATGPSPQEGIQPIPASAPAGGAPAASAPPQGAPAGQPVPAGAPAPQEPAAAPAVEPAAASPAAPSPGAPAAAAQDGAPSGRALVVTTDPEAADDGVTVVTTADD